MLKIVDPAGWSFDSPIVSRVPLLHDGTLGPEDRRQFLKRAGDNQVLRAFEKIAFLSGEIPMHGIALGCTEHWGPNRNGDGFRRDVCRERHGTFTKFARWYRNHKNQDPSKSYGVIKASFFNEPMSRVELLIALNGTKEAAARNGGLVADKELERIERGEDIPTSMSCSVSHDVCGSCLNKAASREFYCDEDTCVGPHGEKRGGCKNNLAKVADDGYQNHVDNPDPTFFDFSGVVRNADRISFASPADYVKAASEGILGGAEQAEQYALVAPLAVLIHQHGVHKLASVQEKMMYQLAIGLSQLEIRPPAGVAKEAFVKELHVPVDTRLLGPPGTKFAAAALGNLAENRVVLTFDEFANWTRGEDGVKLASEVRANLPYRFRDLVGSGELSERLAKSAYLPIDQAVTRGQWRSAKQASVDRSLDPLVLRERAERAVLRGLNKQASEQPRPGTPKMIKGAAADLMRDYAVYELGALSKIAEQGDRFLLTATAVLLQNMAN